MFNIEFVVINASIKEIPEFRFASSGMTFVAGMSVIPAKAGIFFAKIFMSSGCYTLNIQL